MATISFYKVLKQVFVALLIVSTLADINTSAETELRIDLENFQHQRLRTELIKQINVLRVSKNKSVLLQSNELSTAAQDHAAAMVEHDFFSHVSPLKGLRHLKNRLARVGIRNVYAAENLSLAFVIELNAEQPFYTRASLVADEPILSFDYNGQAIPARTYTDLAVQIERYWRDSKPHRLNIVNGVYNAVGVGAELTRNESKVPVVKVVMVLAALPIFKKKQP